MPRITPDEMTRMREKTGLTQQQFATEAGVAQSSL